MSDTCRKCGRAILDGELVTGFDFSSDGGEHIHCPTPSHTIAEAERRYRGASPVAWAVFESGRDCEPEEDAL